MEALFLKILNMSLSAAVVTAAVLLVRLLLRGAPKKWSYFLWSAVGFRLAVPVTLRSVVSLFRLSFIRPAAAESAVLVYIPAETGLSVQPQAAEAAREVREALSASLPAAVPAAGADPLQIWIVVGAALWCAGAAAMLLWGVISTLRLRSTLVGAVRREDGAYETDRISVPFLLGLFRPRIYIPLGLEGKTLDAVLAHERCHIRRGDPLVKCLAFLLLAIHWFNPMVWLAFCLMSRDMEMSCDEKVLAGRESSAKTYSLSLLSFAAARRFPTPAPLGFGETGVGSRIRNALRWKKPRLWVSLAAALLCVTALAACATNPAEEPAAEEIAQIGGADGSEQIAVQKAVGQLIAECPELDPDSFLKYLENSGLPLSEGAQLNIDMTDPDLSGMDLRTVRGDTVLALDTLQGFTLVRVEGNGRGAAYRGILAIVKDPGTVRVAVPADPGENTAPIAELVGMNGGLLGINASFNEGDPWYEGAAYGLVVSEDTRYSEAVGGKFYAVWLDDENRMHIGPGEDADQARDAVEAMPALVIDGQKVLSGDTDWGVQPRTAVGQTADGAILLLVVDGRQDRSAGITLQEETEILLQYGAVQAVNLDGGTNSVMYYNGRVITSPAGGSEDPEVPSAFIAGIGG